MSRPVVLGLLAALGATSLAAQSPLVGVWLVTYPAGVRIENGEQNAIMGTGQLRVEAHGDSLLGEFVPNPAPDLPSPRPTQMTGRAGPGPISLVAQQSTMVEINGTQRPVRFTSTWELDVRGDSLVGTLSHHVEDSTVSAQPPGPVRGVRQRP